MSRKQLASQTGLTEGKIWRIENKNVIHENEHALLVLVGVDDADGDASPSVVPEPPQAPVGVPTVEVLERAYAPPIEPAPEEVATAATEAAEPTDVGFDTLLQQVDRTYDHYVSNSELRTYKRCRRKWWLGWYRGLRPNRESPVGVRQIGDRLHRALQHHYVPSGPATADQLLGALEREITLDRTQLGDGILEDTRKKFEDEANLERIMLEGYLDWLAETGADSELDVIAAEQYVEAPLSEFSGSVAIIGKMDVRVQRRTDGARLFMDHKSVGDLRTPTLMLPLDEQMLHYHLLEELTVEERSDGALYNMLRRVKRTERAKPPFYARVEVRHNKHELANYRDRVVGEIIDIVQTRDDLDASVRHQGIVYPNPTRDCTWDCDFFSICPMFDDNSRVENLIPNYFHVTDPLDYYLREILKENGSNE
jgi:hypothetical protein